MDLQRRAALGNAGDRAFLLAHPELVDTPASAFAESNVLVAERNGAILGFAALALRADGDADLDGLFVAPEHWKTGVGRALVTAAANRAIALGAGTLHAIGNRHAEGFYERLGFRCAGICQLRFGTGLVLSLPLDPDRR